MKAWDFLLCSGLLAQVNANPTLPQIPTTVFKVTQYGAVADGSTDNAVAIQKTIAAATAAGGGTVEFPAASKVYLSGPFTLASRIRLQVDAGAELQALPLSQYPLNGGGYGSWIIAKGDSDVELSGKGIIDGNGYTWWPTYDTSYQTISSGSLPHRPYLVSMNQVERLHIHELTIQNSPCFHLAITANNVTIDSVLIQAPDTAKNTDAIDPAGINWLITEDSISVGDDDIAVKAGAAPCKNYVITHLRIGKGHGISVGGQTSYGLDSMRVDSCRFNGAQNGLRLKANRTNGGLTQHVSYSNITMVNVTHPIIITSYYSQSTSAFTDTAQAIVATTPIWKDITFDNITSTGTGNSIEFLGVPEMPLDSIILNNVTLTAKYGYMLAHVHHLAMNQVTYNASTANTTTNIKQQVDVTWMTYVAPVSSSSVASSSSAKASSSSVTSSSSKASSSSAVTTSILASDPLESFALQGKAAEFLLYTTTGTLVHSTSGMIQGTIREALNSKDLQVPPGLYVVRVKVENRIVGSSVYCKK